MCRIQARSLPILDTVCIRLMSSMCNPNRTTNWLESFTLPTKLLEVLFFQNKTASETVCSVLCQGYPLDLTLVTSQRLQGNPCPPPKKDAAASFTVFIPNYTYSYILPTYAITPITLKVPRDKNSVGPGLKKGKMKLDQSCTEGFYCD